MRRPSDRELMELYDGELSLAEEEELAKVLADDPESRRVVGGLELVGEAVRAWAETTAGPAEEIADRVMARIAAPAPRRRALVRRGRVAAVVVGGLAIAAAVALAIRSSDHGSVSDRVAQVLADKDPGVSVDIEAVDFGGQDGTIYLVQAENDSPTPVVWLEDPEADENDTETL
jgi:hypothetical protein